MKGPLASPNRNVVIAIVVVLIVAHGTYLLLAQSRIPSQSGQNAISGPHANGDHKGQVDIVSAVPDITVTSSEQTDKKLRVILRNSSQKTITAVCIE